MKSSTAAILAIFAYIPLSVVLGLLLPMRRAMITALLVGVLFLPEILMKIKGLPDVTKTMTISFTLLFCVLAMDLKQLMAMRFHPIDLAIIAWVIAPFFSSIANDLGPRDGLCEVLGQILTWGVPYLLGRMYFSDLAGIRELAIGIFIGGLIYVPLCLFENKMSPQLHNMVYGFIPSSFAQTKRGGGYRPVVFMAHGLEVGMWMTAASLVGVWLWQSKSVVKLGRVPMVVLVPVLLVTTVLVKSALALGLLLAGVAVLFSSRWLRTGLALMLMVGMVIGYMALRSTDVWSAQSLVNFAARVVNEERAGSLATRLSSENALAEKAREHFYLGWGGWNRSRLTDDEGKSIVTSDGLWIIVLGKNGVIGLAALTAAVVLPAVMWVLRYKAPIWSSPPAAPAAAIAVLLVLHMIDNLMNGFPNPLFMVSGGALAGLIAGNALRAVYPAVGAVQPLSRPAPPPRWRPDSQSAKTPG